MTTRGGVRDKVVPPARMTDQTLAFFDKQSRALRVLMGDDRFSLRDVEWMRFNEDAVNGGVTVIYSCAGRQQHRYCEKSELVAFSEKPAVNPPKYEAPHVESTTEGTSLPEVAPVTELAKETTDVRD